ncbi:MAG TPA: TetR/AcrR family transcriptional regulator [Candidatus Obscuribacterales bacterium]
MPKIVDRDRYRQELLSHCLALFADKGFRAVTMRQIAASVGVSTGTLYHYFPDKESIFVQLVKENCEKDVAEFFAQVPAEGDVGTKLRRVMAFFLDHLAAYQQEVLIWVDFHQHCRHTHHPEGTVLQQFWQHTHGQLTAYLALPPEQVSVILTFMDGLLLQCLYDHSAEVVAQQAEMFLTLFERRHLAA